MSIIFKLDDRRVIPRLRSFKLSASTGELSVRSTNVNILNFSVSEYLGEQISSWKKNKTVGYAGDLLSSASVLGLESQFQDVAKFLLDNEVIASKPLIALSKKVLNLNKEPIYIDGNGIHNHHEIKVLKHILIQEPKNPIAWMEIGRLYSLQGHIHKASKCIENALFLDKDNRFIVRSASRFFHHFSDDKEKALYVIRNSEYNKTDPWMLSADIAFSTLLGRFSKMAKIGENFIRNGKHNDSSITELASALGTLEFKNGKIKDAKKYLRQSLIAPTDNSLAQVTWMSEKIQGLIIEDFKYDMPLAFEAKAKHYYEEGEFVSSFNEAMRWHSDEPYSTGPIKMASYISSIFLKDHKKSIELIRKAIEIGRPEDMLVNNLIYFLAQDDQIIEAKKVYDTELRPIIEDDSIDSKEKISYIATAGLMAYKTNNPEEGKLYYHKAIQLAKLGKSNYHFALATANYVKEALKFTKTSEERQVLINQLELACKGSRELDINEGYKDALQELERQNIKGAS